MAPLRKQSSTLDPAAQTHRDRQLDALLDFRARRLQRRLDDLERTNPTDIPASSFVPASSTTGPPAASSGGLPLNAAGGALAQQAKKKQSPNVRKILYARKSLKDWLEELPSDPRPPYLSTASAPPLTPARKLCSSCGYLGKYACAKCGEYSCDMVCRDTHARDGGCGVGN